MEKSLNSEFISNPISGLTTTANFVAVTSSKLRHRHLQYTSWPPRFRTLGREEVGDWKVAMDLKHGRLMGGLEQDRLEVLIDGWKRD
ncbi:hypothetical protein P8452_37167 [Trifolium repens]|nr:hypothetical protein P8452_37167 [Trifolium repens]